VATNGGGVVRVLVHAARACHPPIAVEQEHVRRAPGAVGSGDVLGVVAQAREVEALLLRALDHVLEVVRRVAVGPG